MIAAFVSDRRSRYQSIPFHLVWACPRMRRRPGGRTACGLITRGCVVITHRGAACGLGLEQSDEASDGAGQVAGPGVLGDEQDVRAVDVEWAVGDDAVPF